MIDSYDVFYMLPIAYEDTKRGGAGWYKLSWRPIWKQTYSLYVNETWKSWHSHMLGFRWYRCDAHNGWGRSFNHLFIEMGLAAITITFWIRWNFMCMAEGPSDCKERRPLDLTKMAAKRKLWWFGLHRPTGQAQNADKK